MFCERTEDSQTSQSQSALLNTHTHQRDSRMIHHPSVLPFQPKWSLLRRITLG